MVAPSPIPSDSRRRRPPAMLTMTTRLVLNSGAPRASRTRISGPARAPAVATPAARRRVRRLSWLMARPSLALVFARPDDRADDGLGVHGRIRVPLADERRELVCVRLAAEQ